MKQKVQDFNPENWVFRRSSGYAGYDHVNSLNNEQTWIYEEDFFKRQNQKADYHRDYKLLIDFLRCEADAQGYEIENIVEFLDKKYNGNI